MTTQDHNKLAAQAALEMTARYDRETAETAARRATRAETRATLARNTAAEATREAEAASETASRSARAAYAHPRPLCRICGEQPPHADGVCRWESCEAEADRQANHWSEGRRSYKAASRFCWPRRK